MTNLFAIPEILENIFSYINREEDFISICRVNHTWLLEGLRSVTKLYKDRYNQYNKDILNNRLMYDFYYLYFDPFKPVHKKIKWEEDMYFETITNIVYKFEAMIMFVQFDIINLQSLISDFYLFRINLDNLYNLMKKYHRLEFDIQCIIDKL